MRELITIKISPEMGRGIYATRDIYQCEIIEIAELLVLSEKDTPEVNKTDLQWYTFKYNEKQDCLVLGIGEIFNHLDNPNVEYKIVDYKGRKAMLFTSTKDIKQGEQLFIDYNFDTQVNTTNYKTNLIGD